MDSNSGPRSSRDTSSGREKPKVAPAPPPPAEVVEQLSTKTGGFDPSGKKVLLETLVGVLVILGLGVGIVFAGGSLASWATPWIPLEADETLGRIAAEQFKLTSASCDNGKAKAYVEELAAPLIAAADTPMTFTFRVADTDEVNAFALPGGYVTVNRGLLEAAESGEEVAAVLAHELEHAIQRHGTRRILRQLGATALLALILGGTDLQDVGNIAGRLTGLSYDRDQESEADEKGLELLRQANINPVGLGTFFERLSKDSIQPPEFLSTHPDPGRRARLVEKAVSAKEYVDLEPPPQFSCKALDSE